MVSMCGAKLLPNSRVSLGGIVVLSLDLDLVMVRAEALINRLPLLLLAT